MKRAYYQDAIQDFLVEDPTSVLGQLVAQSDFSVDHTQRDSWVFQIEFLKHALVGFAGAIYFEYAIPRLGRRVDVLLIIGSVIYVLEFKVGEEKYSAFAVDQVTDYALDLKNFHESSYYVHIVPILIATRAPDLPILVKTTRHNDKLFAPIKSNGQALADIFAQVEAVVSDHSACATINPTIWEQGRYCPTPSIIEAAMALYNGHSVAEISRSDASGEELHRTTQSIANIIADAKRKSHKAACFVTGVPGAGKTLIGLNVATQHFDRDNEMYSVFLSGNGPLVKILQEALARDRVEREKLAGRKLKKGEARSEVKMFIQNVHHYRDEYLKDQSPPVDHIALFDEAQRAWDVAQTTKFMRQKKGQHDFNQSEPEFLLSCIDRHTDWGVVVCLVGGGQEINTGEAGIGEWIAALNRSYPDWHIHISDRLTEAEFGAGEVLKAIEARNKVHYDAALHLSVSMRSYRAENVSNLVKQILDLDMVSARKTLCEIGDRYPIVITRDLDKAKSWLRKQARGSERYGIVVSSQAVRLRPLAIDVRLKPNPVHWFLADKTDIRSSYYLEDVAREFDIQGLEIDWACVAWDADFRFHPNGWQHHSFRGKKWQKINIAQRQAYLKNAYRVLLTRARQGMVIVVPEGDSNDPTRKPSYYNSTFEYLKDLNLKVLE